MKQFTGVMKHIFCDGHGGPSVMKIKESPIPLLKVDELLLKVRSTAINRADTLQRKGQYPVPPGSTDIMGLEAAGNIIDENGNLGQRVIALLPGGGYAQYVAVHKDHVIPISENIPFEIAGGIAEVYLTAFLQLRLANLQKGDSCLIYAAASGVGIATIQICNLRGIIPIATCSKGKMDALKKFTQNVIDRGLDNESQHKLIKEIDSKGVDAVFDPVGQSNVQLTLDVLKLDGRWILYGLMSGHLVEQFNLGAIIRKRIQLISSTLRSRSDLFKAQLVKEFTQEFLGPLESGQLKPEIHHVAKIQWDQDGETQFQNLHQMMESNENIGKLTILFQE